tara:strand:- start:4728 stop:5492 length:765 start_codon:yes stop_codon:yes gene_type:complete
MVDVNDVPIYVTTSNGRDNILKVFCHLFNKYWSDDKEVIVVGYDFPKFQMPSNFTFRTMGEQIGGPSEWATDLNVFFSSESVKYFIHTLDDQFLWSLVRFDIMQDLFDKMLDVSASRLSLANLRHNNGLIREGKISILDKNEEYDVYDFDQDCEYRVSAGVCLYDIDYFLKYLIPGRTPWQYETQGSAEAKNDGAVQLCCDRAYPVYRVEGFYNNEFRWNGVPCPPQYSIDKAYQGKVSDDDILEMSNLGIISL